MKVFMPAIRTVVALVMVVNVVMLITVAMVLMNEHHIGFVIMVTVMV